MHWAIESFKLKHPDKIPHIVTTNIEHCATELPLKSWSDQGKIEVDFVPVKNGRVHVQDLKNAIKTSTCLVTVMLANNETGVIQPVEEMVQMVQIINDERRRNYQFEILTHTDAAQAFSKIEVSIEDLKVDYVTIVGHKVIYVIDDLLKLPK